MYVDEIEPEEIPISLLLEADPSEMMIRSYLPKSLCFVIKENGQIIAASVIKALSKKEAELCNISVMPGFQAKGIGTELLKFALTRLRQKGFARVELGTGTFGYQLSFYQRLGFRVESVVKDHFLNNYSEEIYENGIQHKDMLRLYADL